MGPTLGDLDAVSSGGDGGMKKGVLDGVAVGGPALGEPLVTTGTLGVDVGAMLSAPVGNTVGAALGANVGAMLDAPVGNTVRAALGSLLGTPVGNSVRAALGALLGAPVGNAVDRKSVV